MQQLHVSFPEYGWLRNKGYGTLEHRKAIAQFGLTPFHRRSFQIRDLQIDMDFKEN
jgi:ribonuclease HII